MGELGLGYLSVFGLPPLEFIGLAADLGCPNISMFLRGLPLAPLGYPPFSLKKDAALRGAVRAAAQQHGVTITLGDGFLVTPDADVRLFAADLDVIVELGIPRINVVSLDPDRGRTFDQFGALAELAAQRGLRTVLEPVPGLTVGDLATALAAVRHVGRPDFQLLIDTMHMARSGSSPADLVAVDSQYIGYAQLNDTTLQPRLANYMEEAMFERLPPGEGELPLREFIQALPTNVVIELEVPQRSLALSGHSPIDRLRPCVDAARRLLSDDVIG
ncbi:xylose isomerase [Mycobacterium asiaticum]|uniref:Xylose isomerase n=1 Tax=Mycobacterium asiaticum TaxID=1790 RepID=A0A1A3PBG9_MYCAS|nr:sugar phosphate isomerase/epimerase family protein [Mycobacterium asiaticum]OBK31573.1 xylose isomerase [Mycobacterium asiaticum]